MKVKTITMPDGEIVKAVRLSAGEYSTDGGYTCNVEELCYAQNRIFKLSYTEENYPTDEGWGCNISNSRTEIIAEFAIIPEADALLDYDERN